ncbi:hypothetical protein D3C87_1701310 [compost metagenome]
MTVVHDEKLTVSIPQSETDFASFQIVRILDDLGQSLELLDVQVFRCHGGTLHDLFHRTGRRR